MAEAVGPRHSLKKSNVEKARERVKSSSNKDDATEAKKRAQVEKVFAVYDRNKTGRLERDNLIELLTDLDVGTPEGTPPTDDEVSTVIKLSDTVGNGCIDKDELETALRVWKHYITKREEFTAALKKHDKSGTGSLNKEELKSYLCELNLGKPVEDHDVEYVLEMCDSLGDGSVSGAFELVVATAEWYAFAAQNEQQEKARQCFPKERKCVCGAIGDPDSKFCKLCGTKFADSFDKKGDASKSIHDTTAMMTSKLCVLL